MTAQPAAPQLTLPAALYQARLSSGTGNYWYGRLTQAELGAKIGRSQTWVSKVESGRKPNIRWSDVHAWCVACNTTVAELAAQLGV